MQTTLIDKLGIAMIALKTFEDSLNTAVFTTTFVVKDRSVITYVTHEAEDGAWQFFSNELFDNYEDVAMIVGLAEIIEIDKSLLDIADLPLGYIATRQSNNHNWVRQKREE